MPHHQVRKGEEVGGVNSGGGERRCVPQANRGAGRRLRTWLVGACWRTFMSPVPVGMGMPMMIDSLTPGSVTG